MNWNQKSAWLYKGDAPDIGKAKAYGITTLYVDPNDPNAASVISTIRANGLYAGIYEATSWMPGAAPADFASRCHADVRRLIPQAYPLPSQAQGSPLMLDLEAVSKDWTGAAVAACRTAMPSREMAYTNEPFKDGTVVPIMELIAAGLHWYPQLYRGDMSPVDPAAVVLEVARWGFPVQNIHPFYDGARLLSGWRDGCVFTLERMP